MKISIITVAKNNKAGLLRAIECVRNQTYQNIEHIIVDGGSTDGTVEILKQVQDKAQNDTLRQAQGDKLLTTNYSLLTISEADSGIYDAINKGIKLATGDVIGLLHSDDLYADEKVITRYAEAFNNHNVDSVYSDLVYIKTVNSKQKSVDSEKILRQAQDDNKSPSQITTYNPLLTNYSTVRYWKAHNQKSVNSKLRIVNGKQTDHDSLITDHSLRLGWMPPHPTLFIKKKIFEKYGLYDTSFKIAADYDMILRLFYKHKITAHYLPFTTYLMSLGGASNKSVNNILLKSKEDLQTLKSHNLPHPLITLLSKNFRKLPQFMTRDLS